MDLGGLREHAVEVEQQRRDAVGEAEHRASVRARQDRVAIPPRAVSHLTRNPRDSSQWRVASVRGSGASLREILRPFTEGGQIATKRA